MKPIQITKNSGSKLSTLMRELIRGKSIPRALLAYEIGSFRLKGTGIDLGSKDGFSAQYRHMDTTGLEITFTDLDPKDEGVVQLDVESKFPMESDSYDVVLAFFLIEHVFDTKNVLAEAIRITRPGGMIIGAIPQTERYHPDPDDFMRLTSSGITRFLEEAGYEDVETFPLGTGPVSIAAQMICNLIKIRLITVPLGMLGVMADLAMKNIAGRQFADMYAFSHLFIATCPTEE